MSYYLKKVCGIYCITHTESGRQYVGQSLNCVDRWRQHTTPRKGSTGIKGAIMKHSVAAFTFSVLEECKREELNEREVWWIAELSTLSPTGYNLTSGGGQGITLSDETRAKMSESRKGQKKSPLSAEHREKTSAALKGRTLSAEHREKLSETAKGKARAPFSDEHRANIGKAARNCSEETRAKMSAVSKGRTLSPEIRQKMSAAQKGRTLSDETRAKLSAAAKERERLKREES